MTKKALIYVLTALLLALPVLSCTREERPAVEDGCVSISFAGVPTRAESPGTETAAEGGAIAIDAGVPDLKVFLVKEGSIVAQYPAGAASITGTCPTVDSRESVLKFSNVPGGDYTVYAFANVTGQVFESAPDWSTISTEAQLNALKFTSTAFTGSRMPLSATAPLNVTDAHNGNASLQLLRCFGKVALELVNQTDDDITLEDLTITLKNMNPDMGYVFGQDPDIPAGTVTGNLEYGPNDLDIDSGDTDTSISYLVFPGTAEEFGDYTCDISFTYNSSDVDYEDLPVYDNKAVAIPSVSRNECLHIQIRISYGHTVSFCFYVDEWASVTNAVEYD